MSLQIKHIDIKNYKDRINNISGDFFKINIITGRNGAGKSTLAESLKGLIWHEKKFSGVENLGEISGEALLDGESVDFNTERENVWSKDNISQTPQSYYELNLNNLLHDNLKDYSEIKAKINSGDLILDNRKNIKLQSKYFESLNNEIIELQKKIECNSNSWDKIESLRKEIDEKDKQINEYNKKIEIAEKLEKYSVYEDEINKAKIAKEVIVIPSYSGLPFNINKDYTYFLDEIKDIAEKWKSVKESLSVLSSYENRMEFKGDINELKRNFNLLEDLNKEKSSLKLDIESLDNELGNEKYKEISPICEVDNKSKEDKYDIIKKIKNSYKAEAVNELKINDKKNFFIIMGVVLTLIILILSISLKNYFILFGCLGSISLFFIPRLKIENYDPNGETCDTEKLWQVSLVEEYFGKVQEVKSKKERLKVIENNIEKNNNFIKNFLIDNGLPEKSDLVACESHKNDTVANHNKQNDELKKKQNEREILFDKYNELMNNYQEIFQKDMDIYEYYFKVKEDYSAFKNYKENLEKQKEYENKINKNQEIIDDLLKDIFPDVDNEYKESCKNNIEENKQFLEKLKDEKKEKEKEINKNMELTNDSIEKQINDKIDEVKKIYNTSFIDCAYNMLSLEIKSRSRSFADNIIGKTKEYFEKFTSQKYTLDDEERIIEIKTQKIKKIEELSSGIRSQFLLATKLSVIENQEKNIRYPLFLDESLASCDTESSKAIIEALETIEDRQIFYFTPKDDEPDFWEKCIKNKADFKVFNLSDGKSFDA